MCGVWVCTRDMLSALWWVRVATGGDVGVVWVQGWAGLGSVHSDEMIGELESTLKYGVQYNSIVGCIIKCTVGRPWSKQQEKVPATA